MGLEAGRRRNVRLRLLGPQGRHEFREGLGLEVITAQVSRAVAVLDAELERWPSRAIGETPYLILDARYEYIRFGGRVRSGAVLIVIGIESKGMRSVLEVNGLMPQAEARQREFLTSLAARGVHGAKSIVSESHGGIKVALAARLTGVPWQRCQFHTMRNAPAYMPRAEMWADVVADLRAIFDANERPWSARRLGSAVGEYRTIAPRPAKWVVVNFAQASAVFASHGRD